MSQFTFAMLKSGALVRHDHEVLMNMLHQRGYKIMVASITVLAPSKIELFYSNHVGKPYWPDLRDSVGGLVLPMLLYLPGKDAIVQLRADMGPTDPKKAPLSTLRGILGNKAGPMADNGIHGSDSEEAFHREIGIIWPKGCRQ